MNLDLSQQVVIVTGGTRGIGAAIVRALSKDVAIPVIAGFDSNGDADRLVASIRGKDKETLNITADLCETRNCQMVVEEAVRAFGGIRGLVNNAGVNDGVGLEDGSPEKFLESIS